MTNLEALRARIGEIEGQLESGRTEMLSLAEGDLDETQTARFDALETERTALTAELETSRRRADAMQRIVDTAQSSSRATEPGDARQAASLLQRRDPFENLDQVEARNLPATDMRARALTAIEQTPHYVADGEKSNATRLVERGDRHGRISRHMLLTGSDAYLRAFENVLGGRQPWQLDTVEQDALRAAMSLTDANGGYLAPFFLDPTIILTNDGATNPFRGVSRVESITTDVWHGITSAGVSAAWTTEASAATESDPTLAQPAITPQKATAWLTGSLEVTEDTNIGSQIGMLLSDARDRLEAAAFATGSGTSGQPKGVVTAVAATSGSVVSTAGDFAVSHIYSLKNGVPPRHRQAGVWVANDGIYDVIRQFGTANNYAGFWADLGADTPSQMLGRSVYESSVMSDDSATANDLILLFGDFKSFLIVDRIGMTLQYDPLIKNSSGVPLGQVGWYAHWRVGSDCVDPNAFRILKVTAGS